MAGRTDRAIIRDLFQLHGVDDTPENLRRFVDAYLEHLPRSLVASSGRVLPGVPDLLQQVADRGLVVGLLTGNGARGARAKLLHYGLHEFFPFGAFGDAHFTRDDVAREALRRVREILGEGVKVDQVVVIGDTPSDVQCARAIGARAVAVATGSHSRGELAAAKPDVLLDDLSQLGDFLNLGA